MSDVQYIFDGLVAQYGGPDALNMMQSAILRKLAAALASDDPITGNSLTSLAQFLSQPTTKSSKRGNTDGWGNLNDSQWGQLLGLTAIAFGGGDIVCDDNGVVLHPPPSWTAENIQKLGADNDRLRSEIIELQSLLFSVRGALERDNYGDARRILADPDAAAADRARTVADAPNAASATPRASEPLTKPTQPKQIERRPNGLDDSELPRDCRPLVRGGDSGVTADVALADGPGRHTVFDYPGTLSGIG